MTDINIHFFLEENVFEEEHLNWTSDDLDRLNKMFLYLDRPATALKIVKGLKLWPLISLNTYALL